MEKFRLDRNYLNRSIQTGIIRLNNLVKIIPKKDEMLFSQKTFLEIILGLIKETQNEYLTKKKLLKKKKDTNLIKDVLLKLINDLKKIKKKKEKNMKLIISQNEQKKLNLKYIVNNTIINQKKIFNSEINSLNILNDDDSYDFNFNFDDLDIKQQNFILENKIKEVDNMINRNNFLIKFYKTPHRFQDHFTEIFSKNKIIKQNITENLHDSLIYIRSIWKNVAHKKNLQDMRLENIRTRIKYIKKESENGTKKDKKYINTEDIIPEENHGTENFREQKKINKKKESKDVKMKLENVNMNDTNDNKIKLDMSDLEKLLLLNINVNINLNQQYINNHYNNFNQNQQNEKLEKDL